MAGPQRATDRTPRTHGRCARHTSARRMLQVSSRGGPRSAFASCAARLRERQFPVGIGRGGLENCASSMGAFIVTSLNFAVSSSFHVA
jgi:hypothetical protein